MVYVYTHDPLREGLGTLIPLIAVGEHAITVVKKDMQL